MDKEYLQEEYNNCRSIKKLAEKIGYSPEGARRLLIRNNVSYDHKKRWSYDAKAFLNDNAASFYWAGFLAADGWVSEKGDLSFGLQSRDKKAVHDFKKYIGSDCNVEKTKRNDFLCVRLRCKEIVNNLTRFGIVPKKSLIYKIPKEIQASNYFRHFIRGYFDGDGCASIVNGYLKWSVSGTPDTCEAIRTYLCMTLKLRSNGYIHDRKTYCVLYFADQKDLLLINNYLYKNSKEFLERKKTKMNQVNDILARSRFFMVDKNYLKKIYNELGSYKKVAKKLKCSPSVVCKYIKLYGIEVKDVRHRNKKTLKIKLEGLLYVMLLKK